MFRVKDKGLLCLVCPTATAMHKSAYRLRHIIKHGPMRLPSKVHPHLFGSRSSAEIVGKKICDDFVISRVCFCDVYRKHLRRQWNARPFNRMQLRRFIKRFYSAAYRYLEAYLTDSLGYRQMKKNLRRAIFPPASEWPHQ